MPTATKASEAFKAFLAGANPTEKKISLQKAADALGVSDVTILHWRDGRACPDEAHRKAIENWTGGAVLGVNWLDDDRRAAIEKARAVRPVKASADEPEPSVAPARPRRTASRAS
jgi:hypothetical protein